MTTTARPRLIDVLITEPLDLVTAQPHQILLSTGSVALMAQYAASGGIVHPLVGYAIAIGVEWAYLRGLASDSKAPSAWGIVLNWSAFAVVVLWGTLWVWQVVGGAPEAIGSFGLAAAHVVPIAWLSLCSAMTHGAAQRALARDARRHEESERRIVQERAAQQAAWELTQAEEDRKLERWKEAQRLKAELKSVTAASVTAPSQRVTPPNRDDLRQAVVTLFVTHGDDLNIAQAARDLGISRPMMYKLRDEARARGELP